MAGSARARSRSRSPVSTVAAALRILGIVDQTLIDGKGRTRGDRQVNLILDLQGHRGKEKIIALDHNDTIDDIKAKAAWRFRIERNAADHGNMFQILQIKGKKRFRHLGDGLRLSDYNIAPDSWVTLTWTDADEDGLP